MSTQQATTPLMQQYNAIKSNFPDALLLFQVGDFYELFYDDAKKAAPFLAITLTARGKNNGDPIPLCGVPVHAAQFYIAKLVKGGFRVALCNQLEVAIPGKVVERGVTQVFTPGTLTDANLLDDKSASYLFSFFPSNDAWGLLFAELMTAQLFATVLDARAQKTLEAELGRFLPDEVIMPTTKLGKSFESYFTKLGYFATFIPYQAERVDAQQWIQQFTSDSQNYCTKYDVLRSSLYTLHDYLKKNQESSLAQFTQLNFYNPEDFLMLDAATQANLELVKNLQDGARKNTLYEHLDLAVTPMGSRTIKKWILRPLLNKEPIIARQGVVHLLVHDIVLAHHIKKNLLEIGDIERTVGRIVLRRATLTDFNGLARALAAIPYLQQLVRAQQIPPLLAKIMQQLGNFAPLQQLLEAACNTDTTKEWIIKQGFDQRLDQLRSLIDESTVVLNQLEQKEQQKTAIQSLKIRFNHMYGYYFEVTKANSHLVPDYFIRSQTLVGKDRFTTTELKTIESDLLIARSHIDQVEKEIFETIKREVAQYASELRKMAVALAHLDALFGLSQVAYNYNYSCPAFNDTNSISIGGGKHPVIHAALAHNFIPNDTQVTNQKFFWIITGPNMGGKSTYLRQVALITLMAQLGSFVPAAQASIALRDRIFTRIGAGDNVADGKSTFLVEMEEASVICHQSTAKSLIILDEIGRGTSTFDGLAIAQAVVEYLYTVVKAPCLFATHYHELTQLQDTYEGIACYHAASKKTNNGIMLLHKIEEGVAEGSFGIEVAKLAQLPAQVIHRAQEILDHLEAQEKNSLVVPARHHTAFDQQLMQEKQTLHKRMQEIEQLFSTIDYENLSPKQAFDFLWKLKDFTS